MKVVIIGAGSTAHMVADTIKSDHNFLLEGFIGTSEEESLYQEKELYGMGRFLGDHSVIPHLHNDGVFGFVVAVGDNYVREKYFYECQQHNLIPVNIISPDVIIKSNVEIGKGVVIGPGVILCSGVEIGDNVLFDPGVICNVKVSIGDHTTIGSGAVINGITNIGKNTTIGARSYISANVGKNNVVGIGDIVLNEIHDKYREE